MTGRNRWLLTYGLAGALILALGAAAVLAMLTWMGPGSQASASTQQSAARNDVQRVASAFAVNVNTYSSDNVDSYAKRVRPLLTDRFERSFSNAIDSILQQMKSFRIESDGEVLATAVSSIDQDSAVVLVVADADVKTSTGDRARHFRWQVDLVRQDGQWLVNDFEPL